MRHARTSARSDCAEPLLESVLDPGAVLGDKALTPTPRIHQLDRRASAGDSPKANRKVPRSCDFVLYCERNLVKRFFKSLKHFRAIATAMTAPANITRGVQLACAMILLN